MLVTEHEAEHAEKRNRVSMHVSYGNSTNNIERAMEAIEQAVIVTIQTALGEALQGEPK